MLPIAVISAKKGDGISLLYPGGQYLVLTFSSGPHFENTKKILNILKKYKAKASFFVDSFRAMNHPEVIRQIIQDGHDIGIQSKAINPIVMHDHITSSSAYLKSVTSLSEIKYFRPPLEYPQPEIVSWKEIISQSNNSASSTSTWKPILWTIQAHAKDLIKDGKDEWMKKILAQVKPGVILLCQDHHNEVVEVLPELLHHLIQEQYYELVSLTQILSFPDDSPH